MNSARNLNEQFDQNGQSVFQNNREYHLENEVKQAIPAVRNYFGEVIYWLLSLITIGLLPLLFRWNKRLFKSLRFRQVDIEESDYLIILDQSDDEYIIPVEIIVDSDGTTLILTTFRFQKYIFDPRLMVELVDSKGNKSNRRGGFVMLRNHLSGELKTLRKQFEGLSIHNTAYLSKMYGSNSTRIPLTPIWSIFIDEGLSAFNLYQIFAAVIWYFRNYFAYAVTILIFAAASLILTIYIIRKDQKKINSMAVKYKIRVHRRQGDGYIMKHYIDSEELIPGDIFEIRQHMSLPCDAILLQGQCLVDESALTGESVPMHKTQLPSNKNSFSEDEKSHFLFSGTRCLTSERFDEPQKPALAVAYQTGFSTSRGLLIRAIMFNDHGKYRFEKDGNLFLLYLILISFVFIGIYYAVAFTSDPPAKFSEVWLPSIDIMLVMVPPGLTLCLGIGVQYAQARLAKAKISVMKGRLINASGRMKVVLFDKTGTLTINEVVLDEVYISDRLEDVNKCRKLTRERDLEKDQPFQKRLLKHFAVNHTLVKMRGIKEDGSEGDFELLGDPLEDELFKFAQARIDDDNEYNDRTFMKLISYGKGDIEKRLGIINVLSFKTDLQRMSVVAEDLQTKEAYSYVKGAPERIFELSLPSTLPKKIESQVTSFSKQGYRVIAFGCKKLPKMKLGDEYTREISEKDIEFQGFALFKNNLKDATKQTLSNLKKNDFYTGMITGDNIDTAISISKTCGLVDIKQEDIAICSYGSAKSKFSYTLINEQGDSVGEIDAESRRINGKKIVGALDNKNFQRIEQELSLDLNKPVNIKSSPILSEIAVRVRIFARMNPSQKALIVKIFKEYYKDKYFAVGFCGDGANDCIALKHADIGVSLSKNEASLSAPFVSVIEDISCIEKISIEGKAALTTNYDCFRYFCLYSIIQTIGLVILYSQKTEYAIPMYLTMDIPLALNVANCIGLLSTNPVLKKKMPKYTLLSIKFLLSILINSLMTMGFFVFSIWLLRKDPDFISAKDQIESSISSTVHTYESTIISLMAIQGTFHIGISFNLKGEFKERFYRQPYFVISLVLYVAYQFYLVFNSRSFWPAVDNFLMDEYKFVVFGSSMKIYVMILLFVYSACSIIMEMLFIWVCVGKTESQKDDAVQEIEKFVPANSGVRKIEYLDVDKLTSQA